MRVSGSVSDNRAMPYELWDTETRNIVNTFESEAEALQAARELIALNSPVYPGALALAFGTMRARGRSSREDRGLPGEPRLAREVSTRMVC